MRLRRENKTSCCLWRASSGPQAIKLRVSHIFNPWGKQVFLKDLGKMFLTSPWRVHFVLDFSVRGCWSEFHLPYQHKLSLLLSDPFGEGGSSWMLLQRRWASLLDSISPVEAPIPKFALVSSPLITVTCCPGPSPTSAFPQTRWPDPDCVTRPHEACLPSYGKEGKKLIHL